MFGNEALFEVDYQVDGNALYRHYAKAMERIVPWGPDSGAWRTSTGECLPFVPEISLSFIEQIAWQPGGSRLPSWRRRVAGCRFLVDRWPEDARDTVRPFPSGHWQLLQFLNAGGGPARELLESNPALGYLASLAGAAKELGLRRRTLAALLGFPETEHAVRLLRKVPAPWITPEFLAQLRTVIRQEPEVDAVIKHLKRINPLALEVLRDRELRVAVAPDCITRLSRAPAHTSQCDLIGRMRDLQEYANARGVAPPRIRVLSDLDRPAPPQAHKPDRLPDTPAVQSPPLPRPRNRSVFPVPPLDNLTAPGVRIEAIRSRQELIAESEALRHCAGRDPSYARRVTGGRLYFYRMIEPERLTIALRREGQRWAIDEVRGVYNQRPREPSFTLIWNWFQGSPASFVVTERGTSTACADATPAAPRVPVILQQPVTAARRLVHPANQMSFGFDMTE